MNTILPGIRHAADAGRAAAGEGRARRLRFLPRAPRRSRRICVAGAGKLPQQLFQRRGCPHRRGDPDGTSIGRGRPACLDPKHATSPLPTGGARGIGLALARKLKARGAAHVALADMDAAALESAGAGNWRPDLRDRHFRRGGGESHGAEGKGVAGRLPSMPPMPALAAAAIPTPTIRRRLTSAPSARAGSQHARRISSPQRCALPLFRQRGSGRVRGTRSAPRASQPDRQRFFRFETRGHRLLAKSLAYTVRDDGVGVSILCPQAVRTDMLGPDPTKT